MDRLESEFIAAYEGEQASSGSEGDDRAAARRQDRDREVVRSNPPAPKLSESERVASNDEQLKMRRAKRGQVEAITQLVRSRSQRIEKETKLLVAQTRTTLRERNTMLVLGAFATLAAIVFVFLGMISDPWFLTGAAAMSTIAGGCGYGLQSLRNRPRAPVSPRQGKAET